MNKKNKILVGCLALLLVLSVGYALFSETITINGTATAKGNFDISVECGEIISQGGTGTCTIEDGIIKTSSNLSKPGDIVLFNFVISNSGTISAKLKAVDSPNNIANDGYGAVGDDGPGDSAYYDLSTLLTACYVIGDDEICSSDSEIEASNITLQPGENIPLIIMHMWKDSEERGNGSEQPVLPESGVIMDYDITFNFEQVVAN